MYCNRVRLYDHQSLDHHTPPAMAVNSLLLVLLLVAIRSATVALGKTVKVWSSCSPANYTPGDPYDTNLHGMLKDLVTVTASYGGYGNDTAGDGPADQSYGLAICYADAPPEVCRLCLDMAAGNVTLACPRAVAADMMYNNCLLRYANASFPARPDMVPRFSFYNNLTRAGDAAISAAALGRLMDRLAPAAAASLRAFAFGRTNMSAEQSLYGFVQCVTGLSPDDCRRCLQRIAASLPMYVAFERCPTQPSGGGGMIHHAFSMQMDERRARLLTDMLHAVRGGAVLHAAQHADHRRGPDATARAVAGRTSGAEVPRRR